MLRLLSHSRIQRFLSEAINKVMPQSITSRSDVINQQPEEDYVEAYVCSEFDVNENEMKTFDLSDAGPVLIVKQNGKISALGTKCSHYGAPLTKGALGDGRIRCPWHGACFRLDTGDIEDFPGQDSIPCYKVTVEEGRVKVRAKRSDLKANKRTRPMEKQNSSDERTFVIIGGGPSAATCAETLRSEGFTGRLVMVAKEAFLPYDRVKISKSLNIEIEKILLRTKEFYNENNIETMIGVEATKLDSANKEITLSNENKIKYDKVYIATGSKPRKPNIPGADMDDVLVLRTHDDASYIDKELAPNKHVVVLGLGFIGLEAAAYASNKVEKVTVIGRSGLPLQHAFGSEVGQRVMNLYEEKGVKFIMNSGIKRCVGDGGKLTSVELVDGTILKADLCIMGVGSTLYTEFLDNSGININQNGSIDTNTFLQSNIPDVYVGGDIANAPVFCLDQRKATIGHYGLSQYHGRIAALNMVSKQTELRAVPFFFTMLFGTSFRYAGHGSTQNYQLFGDLQGLSFFICFFDDDNKVIGLASCGRDPIVAQFAEFLYQGHKLYRTDLEIDPTAWTKKISPQ